MLYATSKEYQIPNINHQTPNYNTADIWLELTLGWHKILRWETWLHLLFQRGHLVFLRCILHFKLFIREEDIDGAMWVDPGWASEWGHPMTEPPFTTSSDQPPSSQKGAATTRKGLENNSILHWSFVTMVTLYHSPQYPKPFSKTNIGKKDIV